MVTIEVIKDYEGLAKGNVHEVSGYVAMNLINKKIAKIHEEKKKVTSKKSKEK
ncbi:hypothetical protein ACJRPK_13860 [Aquimarina sp. 2-A2]|uniref:hypothetical protein n=1 Tax=Aquimarina sp. 2-A2 TaxID=3382644 RepID=UPI00387F0D2C